MNIHFFETFVSYLSCSPWKTDSEMGIWALEVQECSQEIFGRVREVGWEEGEAELWYICARVFSNWGKGSRPYCPSNMDQPLNVTHREKGYAGDVLQRKDNSPNMMQLWTLITQHCQQLVKWVPLPPKGSGYTIVSATNFELNQNPLPV